ncbi:hypothetical protein BG015_003852, partial [Linnemannia schmuckeri]
AFIKDPHHDTVMHNKKDKDWRAAKDILELHPCFLTRGGSFYKFSELISPNEALTENVFVDRQSLFLDIEITAYISHKGLLGGLRALSSSPALVMECVEMVLAETVVARANPLTTRARAVHLVKHIYANPRSRRSQLDRHQSVFQIGISVGHNANFFPADLLPSEGFKTRFLFVYTANVDAHDVLKHLSVLVKDIIPMWKSTKDQLKFKIHLFKVYNVLESYAACSDTKREWTTKHINLYLKLPYILNSNTKDPNKVSSWIWPGQLMFDIDNNIPFHQVVDPVLHQYRNFLVAAGDAEMIHTQDQQTGFMDTRFKFKEGPDILARKVVLARASPSFFCRFTGVWVTNSTRDPRSLVLRLSIFREKEEETAIEEGAESDGEGRSESRHQTPVMDKLAQRMRSLMELQDVANRFEVSRPKDLIAQELIMGQKVIHSNVYSIRGYEEHTQAHNIIKYVEGEIQVLKDELEKLDRKEAEDDDDGDDDEHEPSEPSDDGEEEKETKESFAELSETDSGEDGQKETEGGGVADGTGAKSRDYEPDRGDSGSDEEIVEAVGRKLRGLVLDQDNTAGQRDEGDLEWDKEENGQRNPPDLSEIRACVALFLSSKDCLSCMRVSRAWFQDFVRPVWQAIEFHKDNRFRTMDLKVLTKYGHFIKQVRNISSFADLISLQHAKVDSVTSVSLVLIGDWHYRELVADLIRRCKGQITEIEIHCPASKVDTVVEQRKWDRHYFQINTLLACPLPAKTTSAVGYGLSLEYLDLSRACITREGFSALLQYSPVLRKLKIFQVVVLRYNPSLELFRESSVTSIEAPLDEILQPDPELRSSPTLLIHLPKLQKWTFTSLERPMSWTNDVLRKEIFDHCPLLKTFQLNKTNTTRSDKFAELVLKCAQKLESCTFSALNLELSMAFACVNHLDTLTSLTITDTVSSEDANAITWVYYLPKLCPNLKVLSMKDLVLDMKEVEEQPWTCLGLQELRVRFKELENMEEVERCVKQVCTWRRAANVKLVRLNDKNEVLSRVCIHLRQFRQLLRVCIESREFLLPPSPML